MSKESRDQRTAVVAAALITARSAGSVADAHTALVDAQNLLYPRLADPKYKDWQRKHGMTPSTPEQDEQRKRERAERKAGGGPRALAAAAAKA